VFSLLSWGVFAPYQAKADLFPLFGNTASADTYLEEDSVNSQNMVLLEANVSLSSIVESKKITQIDEKIEEIKEPVYIKGQSISWQEFKKNRT
jgi:hypothetical protein